MSPLMVCVLVCVINAQSELYVENIFTFALVWSIGGEVDSASRAKFDMFLRALARGSAPSKYCIAEGAQVRPWMRWMPEGEATCFEYMFVPMNLTWELWSNSLVAITRPALPPLPAVGVDNSHVLVSTVDTVRYTWLLGTLVSAGTPLLLVGPTGAGKTRIIEVWLQQLPAATWVPPTVVNFSSQTGTGQVSMAALSMPHVCRYLFPCPNFL